MDTRRPIEIAHYETSGEGTVIPYGRRDFYKVWLIFFGRSAIHYADKSILLDRPALIFSNPLVPYAYEGFSEKRTGYYCLFTNAFLSSAERQESLTHSPLFKVGAHPVYFPDEVQLSVITELFEKILAEQRSDYINKDDVTRNYIQLILHEALKMQPVPAEPPTRDAKARMAELFQSLLERQFPVTTPQYQILLRRAGDFARHLSVHVNHLNHVVRAVTGQSTSALITTRILHEAKTLLKNTDWSVNEIAWSLGF